MFGSKNDHFETLMVPEVATARSYCARGAAMESNMGVLSSEIGRGTMELRFFPNDLGDLQKGQDATDHSTDLTIATFTKPTRTSREDSLEPSQTVVTDGEGTNHSGTIGITWNLEGASRPDVSTMRKACCANI